MSICHAASHLSAMEGNHEAHNHTVFQFTISRSNSAPAASAERGANNKRSHQADGHRVGASLRVSGPSQPDGKSHIDRRVPLRVPRIGRYGGRFTKVIQFPRFLPQHSAIDEWLAWGSPNRPSGFRSIQPFPHAPPCDLLAPSIPLLPLATGLLPSPSRSSDFSSRKEHPLALREV
jgi:hypothetical protein